MGWEADVTADSSSNYEIYLELTEDGVDRARVQRVRERLP